MTKDKGEKQRPLIAATQQEHTWFPSDLHHRRYHLRLSQLRKPTASTVAQEPLRASQVFTPQVLSARQSLPDLFLTLTGAPKLHRQPAQESETAQAQNTRLHPVANPHCCARGPGQPLHLGLCTLLAVTCHQPPLPCADSLKDFTALDVHADG